MDGVLLVFLILNFNLMDHVPQRFNLMDQLPHLIVKQHHPKFQHKEEIKTLGQQINQAFKELLLQLALILVKNLI
jgi:hypothetical protein